MVRHHAPTLFILSPEDPASVAPPPKMAASTASSVLMAEDPLGPCLLLLTLLLPLRSEDGLGLLRGLDDLTSWWNASCFVGSAGGGLPLPGPPEPPGPPVDAALSGEEEGAEGGALPSSSGAYCDILSNALIGPLTVYTRVSYTKVLPGTCR